MRLATYNKQPAERKDYDIEYEPWLAHDTEDTLNDVLANVHVISGDSDLPLLVESIEITATRAKLWVSGGQSGATYKVEITAKTQRNRIDQSEIVFKVKDI